MLLQGTSSTGKTRSLWRAIQQLGAEWTVLRPTSAMALRDLPRSGLFDRPVVVWLNELQGFLGPDGTGLSRTVLRDLFGRAGRPVVVVGTIWPDKLPTAADTRDDRHRDSYNLLVELNQWVRPHEVPSTLTDTELTRATSLAAADERIVDAIADRDGVGFTQTLAGAHEILGYYRTTGPHTRLILDAAADARRLGHGHALSAELLRAMAEGRWNAARSTPRPLPPGWFDQALRDACRPLRTDNVQPLFLIEDRDTRAQGYTLADYLEQYLTRTRVLTLIPDAQWLALAQLVTRIDDLTALAEAAHDRSRYLIHEQLERAVAAAGDVAALRRLAYRLREVPGRERDAEQLCRDAAAAGDRFALRQLADWLRWVSGREADAEQAFRDDAAAGLDEGLLWMADWLRWVPGRESDAEQAFRDAAAAGEPGALRELALWLCIFPGRQSDAEQAYRDAAAAGDPAGFRGLAFLLGRQAGRESDAEQAFRSAAAAGDPSALSQLADWLREVLGRETDAEQLYRDAATAGDHQALMNLVRLLRSVPERDAEAEAPQRFGLDASGQTAQRLDRSNSPTSGNSQSRN